MPGSVQLVRKWLRIGLPRSPFSTFPQRTVEPCMRAAGILPGYLIHPQTIPRIIRSFDKDRRFIDTGFPTASHAAEPSEVTTAETPLPADFDVPLAVVLAGAAFEAYAGVKTRGLVQQCPSGEEITYTDYDFLRTKFAGLLRVQVASIQLDENFFGDDVYQLKIGLAVGDSFSEIQGQWDPGTGSFIDETAVLFVHNVARSRLSVCLNDLKRSEEKEWSGFIPVSDLEGSHASSMHVVTLQSMSLETIGSVKLGAEFLPFANSTTAADVSKSEMSDRVLGCPGPALMSDAWRTLCRTVMEAAAATFVPVAFLENSQTDTQVWFMINGERRQLVVAFRGTEQSSWRDLLTDITLTPMTLDTKRMLNSPRRASLSQLSAEPGVVSRVMDTVAQAKADIDTHRQVSGTLPIMGKQSAEDASVESDNLNDQLGTSPSTQETGITSRAISAVTDTAAEMQALLTRVKSLIESGAAQAPPAGETWVHSGFLNAYDSVRGSVLAFVDIALGGEESGDWSVLLTGHSLGGALATLCAFDLAHRSWQRREAPTLRMYNFGSPRVGNRAFAKEYNKCVPDSWRVVNRNDAVTTVPRLLGYCHVGHAVYLQADGDIEIQWHSSEAPFEGVALPHVLPAVGDVVLETVAAVVPVAMKGAATELVGASIGGSSDASDQEDMSSGHLAELWEHEREAWATLLHGAAVTEHMEDYYFKGIQRAVDAWQNETKRKNKK